MAWGGTRWHMISRGVAGAPAGEGPRGGAPRPGRPGPLCPWGRAAPTLPYHPARVTSGPVEEAAAAVAGAMARLGATEHMAVLDLRPGRTASWTYRRAMAAVKNGVYVAAGDM